MNPSTTSTVQSAVPFNMEEILEINKREYERLGIPIINLNVPILCLPNDVAPTHQHNHRQEHPVHTSRLRSSAQAVFGRASPPLHRYTSLTSLTITARASKDVLVLMSLMTKILNSALWNQWGGLMHQIVNLRYIYCITPGHMRFVSVGHKSLSRPSRSGPRSLCSVNNDSCNAMVCVISELIS
jgi:hypothetical protein